VWRYSDSEQPENKKENNHEADYYEARKPFTVRKLDKRNSSHYQKR
jgi:hypothetical protein